MAPKPFGITSLLGQVKPVMRSLKAAGIGSPVDLTGLDKRAASLRSFLGSTDYSAQNKEATDFAKLQFALSLMGRGFAAMGATPKRGESALGTLGRTLVAPIAGDVSTIAGPLMKQRAATRLAEQQEERQLKLAALNQAQDEKKAREGYAMGFLAKAAGNLGTNDFTLNKVENVSATMDIGGKRVTIPAINLSVQVDKKNPKNQTIVTIGQTTLPDGTVVPAGHKVLGYKKRPKAPDTTVKRGLFGQVYDPKSGTFRTLNMVTRMQDIIKGAPGESSTLKDRYFLQGPGGKMVPVNGFVENRPSHGPFTPSGSLYVVDPKKIAQAFGVPEDSVKMGDIIKTFRRPAITKTGATEDIIQRRFKGLVVENKLTNDLINSAAIQTTPLTEKQKHEAGQVVEERTAFINTSAAPVIVAGRTIAPREIAYFTIAEQGLPAFLQGSFRAVGDVSTDPKPYMFKGLKPRFIKRGGELVEYAPGDEISLTPQEWANLSAELQKELTTDPKIRAGTLKKNYFAALWKQVAEEQNIPKPGPLGDDRAKALLAMFPAGMRGAGGKNLRKEIFLMLRGLDDDDQQAALKSKRSYANYADSITKRFDAAKNRYNEGVENGFLQVPWEDLNFEDQVAFSRIPKNVMLRNLDTKWTGTKDNLAKSKARYKNFTTTDLTAYAAAAEMRVLAKWLLGNKDFDKTGRWFGFLGNWGVSLFADVSIITSGASQRIRQIINRMRSSYQTLASTAGPKGKDSVFSQKIQNRLLPAFSKTEAMNRRDLESLVNRLDLILKTPFSPAVQGAYVIPQSMVGAAKEAGIEGAPLNLRKYPWIDPREEFKPLIEKKEILESLKVTAWDVRDALEKKIGTDFPPDRDGVIWRKISATEVQKFNPENGKLVAGTKYAIKDIKAFKTVEQEAFYKQWQEEHKGRPR
jgi:hypothetical protein